MRTWIAGRQVIHLAVKNVWRWRLIALMGLIAASFSIFVLYGSLMTFNSDKTLAKIDPLELPVDIMVVAKNDLLNRSSTDRFLTPKGSQAMLQYGEEAVIVSVDSAYGKVKLLGLKPDSGLFAGDIEVVAGSLLTSDREILLPERWASTRNLKVGSQLWLAALNPRDRSETQLRLKVVGLYAQNDDLSIPIIGREDAYLLRGMNAGNCYLGRLGAGVQLEQAVEWVQTLFPGDSVLSALTPTQMARKLIGQRNRSGWGLLLLIEVFVGAAILTINMITFLERRRELAVLKTLGMSNSQISLMLGTEILGATGAGLVIGGQVIRLAGARASWMVEISASSLARLHLLGAMLSLVATGLAVAVPVVMARVAAVNELLFARTIPIARQTVNQVEHTYSWVVERERSEGVRLLRLDLVDGDFDGILMKSPGDKVKRGEVIASLDTMFGFHRKQWASPCDGRIVEYEAVSGYMVIQPNERLAPVSIQVQTFQAGPAHSPGNWQAAGARSRLQPVPTTMSSATVPRGRVVWWKRPAVLGGVLCAMLAVSGLGMLMPRGLPVTNYPFASPYPSYEQWVNDLRLLASDHPDLVRLSVLGQTHEGREILGLTITDFAAGDDTTKPGFLLIAGQHANEAIGWQVGLAVLEQLLDDYGTQTEAAEILKQKAIYAVPMVNPDGYEIFTKVTTMHRANGRPIVDNDGDGQFNEDPSIFPSGAYLRSRVRFAQDWLLEHADDPFVLGWQEHAREEGTNYRLLHGPDQQTYVQVDQDGDGRQAEDPHDGVDPNRNFAANWRKLGIIGEYGGEEPWSDAESRAVRDLVLAHPNIRQAVDLHSGQEQILFPYAFGSAKAPDHERFLTWGNTLRPNELIKVQPYHKLNEHSGTAMDWLYSQGIKPFVFEVYHGRVEYRVYYGGTYGYDWNSEWIYNPRDDAARQTVIERWVPVIYEWMAVSP